MAVQNVQCQLAEMQIGRYVSGEHLSDEALSQLHRHIARCPSCANVLAERRTALRSMLSHGYAAVTTDVPSSKEHLLIKALRAKANAAEEEAPAAMPSETAPANPKTNLLTKLGLDGSKGYAKPILFTAALALVLAGMSYFKGQNSLLGGSADTAFPATNTSPTHPAQTPTVPTEENTPPDTSPHAVASESATAPPKSANSEKKKAAETAVSDLSSTGARTTKTPAKKAPKAAAQDQPSADENEPAVEDRVPQSVIDAARARVRKIDEEEGRIRPISSRPRRARKHEPKSHHHLRSSAPTIKIYDESGNPLGN